MSGFIPYPTPTLVTRFARSRRGCCKGFHRRRTGKFPSAFGSLSSRSLGSERRRTIAVPGVFSGGVVDGACLEASGPLSLRVVVGLPQKQNFQYIPFYRFIEKVKYKAVLAVISVDFTEEAYISKVSFLDHDELPVWDAEPHVLSGTRSKVIYQTFRPIHADVNGSLNIVRKVIGDKVYETSPDRSIAAMPVRVNPLKAFCV